MVTIKDVAIKAGVSKGTVSSVFTKQRYVSPEVSDRVLKSAKKLNYYPNQIARSLAERRTMTIGIKMPSYTNYKFNYFETKILNGVIKVSVKYFTHMNPKLSMR